MNKIKMQNKVSTDLSMESESEYFFDDQFSIPFDANLKEENNNISTDISLDFNRNDYVKNASQLCQSFSESCIYSDLDSSYQRFPDILDDLLDRKMLNKEILFTPPQSGSEMEIKDSMIRSSMSQSSLLLKELLTKQLSRDYRITFEEKSGSNLNKKTFSLINCSNSLNDNDNSNANKVTWNQMSNKNHSSLLKLKTKVEDNNVEGNFTTWRQLKDNASNKVISWNKLKTATKDENLLHNNKDNNQRGRSVTKNNNSIIDTKSKFDCNESVKYRAHSEPRKSHRFSGTLLEIYSRTRGLNQSKNSQEFFDLCEYKINSDKNKVLINFGAQFPPINNNDFHPRQRSNSLLDKKSQRYPGLGLVKTPKSTRLTNSAFLSKTLPDLSFLIKDTVNVSNDIKRLKGSITAKDSGFDSGSSNNEKLKDSNQFCSKCLSIFYDPPITDDLIKLDDKSESHHRSVPNFQSIDLLTGSPITKDKSLGNRIDQTHDNETPLKSCLRQSLDRSVSEPDFGNSKSSNTKYSDYNTESVSSSTSDLEGTRGNKAKKSVSFSEKILKKPLSPIKYYGSSISLWKNDLEMCVKPQEIPRDWGLYGNGNGNMMISEFVLGAQIKCGKENELSNEDLKYKVMIRDVIKAVQETIANCSEQASRITNMTESKMIRAPLFVVDSFYAVLIDGILPYQKNIVSIRSRYRLWNVVESSCNNVEYMNEIMKAVKKVPIANEKNRFKVFVSHLINAKLLQRWFNELVNNEALLKNNYSKESFLRQVNTNLKGLYADLDTNLQLLDRLPYGNLTKTKSSQTKEKSVNLKPTTSVKSLKKSNMNQSSSNVPTTKFQEINKFKLNSQIDTDTKLVRTSIPSKSKISITTSSNSSASSTPSIKKPVIYYPKYTVGKGKI